MTRHASIADARRLAKTLEARGVIVVSYDETGRYCAASYGRTIEDCRILGAILDAMQEHVFSWDHGEWLANNEDEDW
jgi:hypothetical protein